MARFFILTVFFTATVAHAQTDTNLLTYKDSNYYKEGRIKISDTLYQEIVYDNPGLIDDNLIYSLELRFINSTVAQEKKVLNLATDTSIVKSSFFVYRGLHHDEQKNNTVSGQIEIVEWTKRKVVIKEDISIYNIKNEKRKLVGIRTFKKRG